MTCPAKILILGGYAILNSKNQGISLAVNERFYCILNPLYQKNDNNLIKIIINSQQIQSKWEYEV